MKRRIYPAGTKRAMRIGGMVVIVSWLIIAYTVDSLSADSNSYLAGRLGALGLIGIGFIIMSFFIKEKKKKE